MGYGTGTVGLAALSGGAGGVRASTGAGGMSGRVGANLTATEAAASAPQVAVGERALPRALSGGPANTHVYLGIRDGKPVYTGVTSNIDRRYAQHGSRFDKLEQLTTTPLTRGQARSVEQALIVRNGASFENKINSISPTHSYYDDAVSWGEDWLRQNGL